jgi:hypothetical protein
MPATVPTYAQKTTIVANIGQLIISANAQASLAAVNASSDIFVAV